ncbi:MAG: cation:dicarboxylase symporter family transporter, partial [Spirochaetes bacterium]|nr:cation:dicarboxylase symporter family transporter [Spirochaetota bacterium]
SFDHILDLVVKQFIEIFAFGAIFIFASLVKIDFFSNTKLLLMLKPLYAVITASLLIIIIYFIVLYIFFKKKAFNYLMSILGSGFISFATGNSAASIIPVSEHLKNNSGVNKNLSDTLTPIGMIINKSGTVIVSTITLLSLILILTPDRLTINLQLLLMLFIFLFSFIQDGANSNAFLIIVISILKINFLHLEEDSYLLFYASIPLFSRIAVYLDSLSTSIFIILTAKFTNNLEEVKYIDYI